MFRKNPNKKSLDTIITLSKEIVNNAPLNIKRTGLSSELAKSYSQYWLNADDNPRFICNKNKIDEMFVEILDNLDELSKYSISEEVRAIYINVIDQFSKKIYNVYQL